MKHREKRQLCAGENFRKGHPHRVRENLPIGKSAVDRRAHGTEVSFADRRPDRRASHAWAALLLAVGVGALLGMLVRRK